MPLSKYIGTVVLKFYAQTMESSFQTDSKKIRRGKARYVCLIFMLWEVMYVFELVQGCIVLYVCVFSYVHGYSGFSHKVVEYCA